MSCDGGVFWLCSQPRMMDSDEEWNLDDDEEVVMPRELPKGSLCLCDYDSDHLR